MCRHNLELKEPYSVGCTAVQPWFVESGCVSGREGPVNCELWFVESAFDLFADAFDLFVDSVDGDGAMLLPRRVASTHQSRGVQHPSFPSALDAALAIRCCLGECLDAIAEVQEGEGVANALTLCWLHG